MSLVSCLVVLGAVTSYQMVFTDSLVSSIGSIMIVLGAYIKPDDGSTNA